MASMPPPPRLDIWSEEGGVPADGVMRTPEDGPIPLKPNAWLNPGVVEDDEEGVETPPSRRKPEGPPARTQTTIPSGISNLMVTSMEFQPQGSRIRPHGQSRRTNPNQSRGTINQVGRPSQASNLSRWTLLTQGVPVLMDVNRIYKVCGRIVNNKFTSGFFSVLTVFALTGDDLRLICTEQPADIVFNILTLVCLVCFSVEIVLSCLGKDDYFPGFFFGLDVISTATLVLDLTWVADSLISGDEDDFDRARSGRTARIGAKAGRIVRVIRLIRIVKLYKAYYESRNRHHRVNPRNGLAAGPGMNMDDDDWGQEFGIDSHQPKHDRESLVGKKLSGLTTQRVIIMVLTMLLVVPNLRAESEDTTPSSATYGADDVWEAFWAMSSSGSGTGTEEGARFAYEKAMLRYLFYHNWYTGNGDCPNEDKGCSNLYNSNAFWVGVVSNDETVLTTTAQRVQLRADTVQSWAANVSVQDDVYNYGSMPAKVLEVLAGPWDRHCRSPTPMRGLSVLSRETDENSYAVDCPSQLRVVERSKWNPRLLTVGEYQSWHFAFYFDLRPNVKAESAFNLGITAFVCVVLCVASVFFSKDANSLVLEPVEAMITKVEKIRDNPLIAMKMADDEFRQEEVQKSREKLNKRQLLSLIKKLSRCEFGSGNSEVLETVILDKTIIKLGTLLALGFGEAGANIVSHNMAGSNTAGVNAMVAGTRVECILGIARIKDFTTATEVLQGKVMGFVNQIAEIVHGVIDEHAGAANKNKGETFMLIWRTEGMDNAKARRIADMSVVAFAKILGAVHRSPVLASYRLHPGLQQRLGQKYRVNLSFGLHSGWAIEGAVGSEFKIDASYLSPNVSIAASVEHATTIYGVPIVASQNVMQLLSKELSSKCRRIDKVVIRGSKQPMELYSLDLDYMGLDVDEPRPRYYVWSLRQRYHARQLLEAEKNRKWTSEVSMAKVFDESPDIATMRRRFGVEFLQLFNMGYQNYSQGEWAVSRRVLKSTELMLGIKDGPSTALLNFMEGTADKGDFAAPDGWAGVHEFGVMGSDSLAFATSTAIRFSPAPAADAS